MNHHLYINICGVGSPSTKEWYLSQDTELQRLYYIYGGTGEYTNGDGTMRAFRKGYVYLFPYNLKIRFRSSETNPVRHLFFDFLSTAPVIAKEPLSCDVSGHSSLAKAVDLAGTVLSGLPGGCLRQEPLGIYLLQVLLEILEQVMPIPYSHDAVINGALQTIQSDYAQPLTVTDLAKRAGYEGNYFIRRFRSVMGQTPYAYLRNYRLMNARQFLSMGCTYAETAALVGYDSASSLARALRKSQP